eukprot:3864636-Prymnesium_polylepis.1
MAPIQTDMAPAHPNVARTFLALGAPSSPCELERAARVSFGASPKRASSDSTSRGALLSSKPGVRVEG